MPPRVLVVVPSRSAPVGRLADWLRNAGLDLDERAVRARAIATVRAHPVAAARARCHSSAGTGLKQATWWPGSTSTSGGTSWRDASTS